MSSPSEALSKKIVARLTEAKLIVPGDASQVTENLAEGRLRAEDWKLLIEKGMDVEAKSK
jgi:hypothetical protein